MAHIRDSRLSSEFGDPSGKDTPDVVINFAGEGAQNVQIDESENWQPSQHEKLIMYTLAAINLIVALDATIIVTSLTAIVKDIGGSTTQAFWIGTSYLLVNAVSMPVICSISDVVGRPICLTFSIAVFTIGTIVCSTAHSIGPLLVGRSIQGIGGGGIHSVSLVVQTDFVPLRHRPKWYGVTLAAWALGLSTGPIIGGAIAEKTTWRWIFYLMFPILAFGLVAVPYLLTLRPKSATAQEKFSRIDWVGMILFTGSATSFLIAISWGGTQYPWSSGSTLAPLIIGTLGMIATIPYEVYVAKHPFLPKNLFRDTSAIVIYIAAAMQGLLLYSSLYYVPFYFLSVKNYGPLDTGVNLLPNSLTFAAFGIITGRLITRFNNFRLPIWIGWFLASVGTAMYVVWRVNDSKPVWVVTLLVTGIAHGIILNAQNFATQALCEPGYEGTAAGMYIFVRQFGIALGVGVGATTFQNSLKMKLGWSGLPTEIAAEAEGYLPTLHQLPAGHMRDQIYDAYKFGLQVTFATWLGISIFILFICLLFIRHADMNRRVMTEHSLDGSRMDRHWGRKKSEFELES
ncbi:MFS general substrate transporter [Nemania abortiva]|nr:MFS general substrate transporter [Nemania abortiva]